LAAIRIVVDSSADIPAQLIKELDITVIPLIIIFGNQAYEDTSLSREEFWRRANEHSPTTSQPALGAFRNAFARLVDAGHRVFCLTITGAHSGTFSTATRAAQEFGDRVTVFDSKSLSMGMGLQAIEAAKLAAQGASLEAIVQRVQSLRDRLHLLIQLETLESIRRGGRLAKLMPTIDRVVRMLNLYPILNIVDGELKLLGVARSLRKGLHRIVKQIKELGPLEHLFVMHIRAEETAHRLADLLAEATAIPRGKIFVSEAGAVLACHGGQGTIGVAAITAE